jgi:hypothetical protein
MRFDATDDRDRTSSAQPEFAITGWFEFGADSTIAA